MWYFECLCDDVRCSVEYDILWYIVYDDVKLCNGKVCYEIVWWLNGRLCVKV